MSDDCPTVLVVAAFIVIIVVIIICGALGTNYTKDGAMIRVIDGCEYIVSGLSQTTTLTHKANCTNHIHSWNQ